MSKTSKLTASSLLGKKTIKYINSGIFNKLIYLTVIFLLWYSLWNIFDGISYFLINNNLMPSMALYLSLLILSIYLFYIMQYK